MPGPLARHRIVDCTAMTTGPLATMILADQGAEVIEIEPPEIDDVMRQLGTERGGMSAFFASCNRSKRSAVLNLRDARGRALLERLIAGADPLALARIGLPPGPGGSSEHGFTGWSSRYEAGSSRGSPLRRWLAEQPHCPQRVLG